MPRRVATLVVLAAVGCGESPAREPPVVRVAAAADLALAFEEIGRAFETETGARASFTFGSSGLLARQIREGAPFDVYAAASASFVDDVVQAGACDGATKAPYARGRIVVFTKRGLVAPASSLAELEDARFRRIAIANPEHAPYGRAAREALRSASVWTAIEPRLVYGENVRQTLELAETGNAEAAIVALALVANDRENPWTLVDEGAHAPLDQALVVCTHGENRRGGESFARFVGSDEGRAIMRRHGFPLPGEEREPAP
jgi:molybdate transport system substrate-binding protein